MTRERFEKIIDMLEQKFEVLDRSQQELSDDSGGTKEVIEFNGPLGKMKLEFTEKPRLLGEKTSYSKRIGGDVQVAKQYDPEDMVSYLEASVWNEAAQEWREIEAGKLAEI